LLLSETTSISAANLKSKFAKNFLILLLQYSWKLLKDAMVTSVKDITIMITAVATRNADSNFDERK